MERLSWLTILISRISRFETSTFLSVWSNRRKQEDAPLCGIVDATARV
jgi:hypothetical protein